MYILYVYTMEEIMKYTNKAFLSILLLSLAVPATLLKAVSPHHLDTIARQAARSESSQDQASNDDANRESEASDNQNQESLSFQGLVNQASNFITSNKTASATVGAGLALVGSYLFYKKLQPTVTVESLNKEYQKLSMQLQQELPALDYIEAVTILYAYAHNELTDEQELRHAVLLSDNATYEKCVDVLNKKKLIEVR